jgi:excreted virulence factor EspC (type VII ESX diderm)
MGDGYRVKPEQLRQHAANIDALKERFAAVKSASAHIAQDDQAYGLLCGWISGILEGKHQRQDQLIAFAENNLTLVAQSLRDTADDYENNDADAAGTMDAIGTDLGGGGR